MIQVSLAVSATHALISSAGHMLFVGTWSWSSTGVQAAFFTSLPLGGFVAWRTSSLNQNSFAVSI